MLYILKSEQLIYIIDALNYKILSVVVFDKNQNKMEYTFSGNPWYIDNETYDDIIIGLHVPKRFEKILSINKCHINNPIFNPILG